VSVQTLGRTYLGRTSLPARAVQAVRDVYRYRELVRYLVATSLRTENVATVFGFLWWLLDPLLLMLVYTLLMDIILQLGEPNFPLFILAAILPFEFFTRSVRNSMAMTLVKERAMRQVAFPKAVVPLASTFAETAHLLAALALFVVFALPFGVEPSPVTLLVLPVTAVLFLFALGVAFFFSALNVFFRDTNHLTTHGFRFWFYLSPGLYAVSFVPEQYQWWFDINPFTTFFAAFRDTLIYQDVPDMGALAVVAAVSLVVLAGGFLFFVGREPSFAKVD